VVRLHVGSLTDAVRPLERDSRQPLVVHHDTSIAPGNLGERAAIRLLTATDRTKQISPARLRDGAGVWA
jgi:hypothetical protein